MAATKKGVKKTEKLYSYDEFRKTFYPSTDLDRKVSPQDPKVFGRKLGEEALRKIREQTQNK
jgi:hypothetical protein